MITSFQDINFEGDLQRLSEGFIGRDWVLKRYDAWLRDPNALRFFLVTGEPGSGKSALAAHLVQARHPAAHHFCIAGRAGTSNPNAALRSLAYQLGKTLPGYASALANTIDPIHLTAKIDINVREMSGGQIIGLYIEHLYTPNPQTELEILLRAPLRALPAPASPIVLLVDSLDEAFAYSEPPNLVSLLSMTEDLPAWVRFVCTSRPDDRVLSYLPAYVPCSLDENHPENRKDLQDFVLGRIAQPAIQQRLQQAGKTTPALVQALKLDTEEINFLFFKYLLQDIANGSQSLDTLDQLPKSLDEIYRRFLLRFHPEDWRTRFQPIFKLLSVAREALSESQLSFFTGLPLDRVRQDLGIAIQFLDKKLSDDARTETYRLYHQSLREYLTNSDRNKQFFCDPLSANQKIAETYLKTFGDADLQLPWSECDHYGLRHLPVHLAFGNLRRDMVKLLLDFHWLQAKLEKININSILQDYDRVPDANTRLAADSIDLVRRALSSSAQTLARDRAQLAGQLLGRLQGSQHQEIQDLCKQAAHFSEKVWLRPLTASLSSPDSPLQYIFDQHQGTVRTLAITPDGRRAVTAGNSTPDRTIRVWDLEFGLELFTIRDQIEAGGYNPLGFTPDGKWVLCAIQDEIWTWNVITQQPGPVLKGHLDAINWLTIAENGLRAISCSQDGGLIVWDLTEWAVERTLPNQAEPVYGVAITPDGRKALSVSPTEWKIWDLESGEVLYQVGNTEFHFDSQGFPAQIVLSFDGKWVVAGNLKWVLGDSQTYGFMDQIVRGRLVAISSDGRMAVEIEEDGRTLKVWDATERKESFTIPDQGEIVSSLTITPDGKQAIVGYYDHKLKVWNLGNRTQLTSLSSSSWGLAEIAVTADGTWAVATPNEGSPIVYNLANFLPVRESAGERILAESQVIADNSRKRIQRFEATYLEPAGFSMKSLWKKGGERRDVEWVLDMDEDQALTTVHEVNKVSEAEEPGDSLDPVDHEFRYPLRVWDLKKSGEIQELPGHGSPVTCGQLTPDGKHAVTGSLGWVLRVWDLEQGKQQHVLRGHRGRVNRVDVSADQKYIVSVSDDRTLNVWDFASGALLASFTGDADLNVCAIVPNTDTNRLLVVCGDSLGAVHFLRLEEPIRRAL